MQLAEIVIATLLAIYAIVGGAVLNAAITNPHSCAKVLDWLWPWVAPLVPATIALCAVAIWQSWPAPWLNHLFLIAAGQAAVLVLFWLANRFSGLVIRSEQKDPGDSDHCDD